jgi:hypothetical protein
MTTRSKGKGQERTPKEWSLEEQEEEEGERS